jgi:hypothetical protein
MRTPDWAVCMCTAVESVQYCDQMVWKDAPPSVER